MKAVRRRDREVAVGKITLTWPAREAFRDDVDVMFWVWDDWWAWGWSWLSRLEYARWLFLASALAKGSLIRVYKPIAQLSLFLESFGGVWRSSAPNRVTLVFVPSSEVKSSDIPFMKFWGYFHSFYGKRFPLEVKCVWLMVQILIYVNVIMSLTGYNYCSLQV